MKNRYGMDGMAYYADIDASTGHIEIDERPRDVEESGPPADPKRPNDFTPIDKKNLNPLYNNFFKTESVSA